MGIPTVIGFAAAEAGGSDILSALGIDLKLFAMQVVGFLLLVWALSKWVFPIFFKIVDKRQAAIDDANKAAVDASKQAQASQEETDKLLKQAREDAKDIVVTAHEEASTMLDEAEKKSREQAEYIVQNAREQLAKEVVAAKKALHNETVNLVMAATTKVLGGTVTAQVDKTVVSKALKEIDS